MLQKTDDGRYLNLDNEVIPLDEFGRPLDITTGKILPQDEHGQYVYNPQEISTTVEAPKTQKPSKTLNATKWTPILDVEDEEYIIKRLETNYLLINFLIGEMNQQIALLALILIYYWFTTLHLTLKFLTIV